ncbi:PP2C family protein-serine/threonine phosphatase [Streptomyces beijiangensis]
MALLLSTPEAAVFVDAGNRIASLSPVAAELLPDLRVGDELSPDALSGWLVCRDVHLRGCTGHGSEVLGPAESPGRSTLPAQDIHPNDGPGPEPPAVLWDAGMSWEQCIRTVAHRLVGRWADGAAVMTSFRRGSAEVTWTARHEGARQSGSSRHEHVRIEVEAVPGLAEALGGGPSPEPFWQPAPTDLPPWLTGPGAREFDSLLIMPIPGDGVSSGALVLLRREPRPQEPMAESAALRAFARQAAAALHAAGLQRIVDEVATGLGDHLRPPAAVRFQGADVAGAWRPSPTCLGAGGDFYDFLPRGSPTMVVLGDVCGSNARSALRASVVRGQLAALAGYETTHRELVSRLNDLQPHDDEYAFASLILASVAPGPRGGLALRISTAGHPPALVLRSGGRVESIASGGTLIGVLPRVRTRSRLVQLRPGETCLLYSDGLTEARGGVDGDLLGEDRFSDALAGCYGLPPGAVVERMLMTASQWLNGRDHDDITLVAIQAPPHPGGAVKPPRTGRRKGTS